MPRVGPAIAESRARRAEIRPTGNTWQTTRGRRKQTPYARGKPSCCLTSFALPQHPPTPRALNPAAYAITTRTHTREDMPLRTTADRMKEQPTMREKAHLIASSLPCAYLVCGWVRKQVELELMRLIVLLPGRKARHAVVIVQQCRD